MQPQTPSIWDNPEILEAISEAKKQQLLLDLPPIVALAGRARSGKDTSGVIINKLIKGSKRYAFADPIREGVKAMFGIDMYLPYWIERKEDVVPWLGKSPRQLMQTLGTEWGRDQVHNNVWVLLAHRALLNAKQHGHTAVIITDYRFPNEGDWLEALGACVIHVERPGLPAISDSGHISEKQMPIREGDFSVVNDELRLLEDRLYRILKSHNTTRHIS